MREKIEQIKNLLAQLELEADDEQGQEFSKNYNALELPSIVTSIIEYLHPQLTPYEIAIYWYLFNKSIVKTGEQYARASTRGMSAIAKSASGKAEELSYGVIKRTIDSLKDKGIISIAGDTSRDGTLYKVAIPDEIPICKELMKKSVSDADAVIDIDKELDYYNVAENRLKVFERDGYKCHYCSKQLTRFSATLDHIQPVSKGGDNSIGNLVTACLHCNAERGNKPVMDYVTQNNKNEP
jgi:hypothetical protein